VLAGLEAVQRTYRHALQLQDQVGRARAEMIQARVILGEMPAGMKGTAPNRASVLADTYPVIRELLRWSR
jgi:hypothetical protein